MLTNTLLASLPSGFTQHLLRHAEKVELRQEVVLHEPYKSPQFAYFPVSGVCSVVTRTSDGNAIETVMIGNEGCTAAAYLIGQSAVPSQYVQQVAGVSFRVPYGDLLAAFRDSEPVRNRILALVQVWTLSMGQLMACQRLHRAEQRLARWLLLVRQRAQCDRFQLNHEFLSEMLGCGRPKVTLLLLQFRECRLVVSQPNGFIMLLDVPALEQTACECHGVINGLYDGLYKVPAAR